MPRILLNGNPEAIDEELTVGGLLESRSVDPKRVVVELNRLILPRDQYDNTVLKTGDVMEIVTFVGGG